MNLKAKESLFFTFFNLRCYPGQGQPSPGVNLKFQAPLGPGIGGVVGDTDKDRRCSVISVNQTKPLMHFPVKNKKITREKFGDIRRPSDLWQGIYLYDNTFLDERTAISHVKDKRLISKFLYFLIEHNEAGMIIARKVETKLI